MSETQPFPVPPPAGDNGKEQVQKDSVWSRVQVLQREEEILMGVSRKGCE